MKKKTKMDNEKQNKTQKKELICRDIKRKKKIKLLKWEN